MALSLHAPPARVRALIGRLACHRTLVDPHGPLTSCSAGALQSPSRTHTSATLGQRFVRPLVQRRAVTVPPAERSRLGVTVIRPLVAACLLRATPCMLMQGFALV